MSKTIFKYSLATLFIFFFLNCKIDDICIQDIQETPDLILLMLDSEDNNTRKSPLGFRIRAIGTENILTQSNGAETVTVEMRDLVNRTGMLPEDIAATAEQVGLTVVDKQGEGGESEETVEHSGSSKGGENIEEVETGRDDGYNVVISFTASQLAKLVGKYIEKKKKINVCKPALLRLAGHGHGDNRFWQRCRSPA